jgi:hypothetical protein
VAKEAFARSGVNTSLDDTYGGCHEERRHTKDLEAFDLLRALIGVSNVATGPDWQESARRLVDILIRGSRPMK